MSCRAAAAKYHVPKSTAWDWYQQKKNGLHHYKRMAFAMEEENTIVEIVLRCAYRGVALNWRHVSEAASLLTYQLPRNRKTQLPFRERKFGTKSIRSFHRRHKRRF